MVFTIISGIMNIFAENSNDLTLLQLGLMCLAFIMVIPLYVIAGYTNYMFAKSYGKSTAFCVLSIFFSGIMVIIMGFDKNTYYVGPKGISQYDQYGGL